MEVTGNIYFPNEANPAYPGGYKSAFTLSDGFLESNFGAAGGNLYFGAGFAPGPTSQSANMYIGDVMNLNAPADALDHAKVTKIINGGTIGLEDRIKHTQQALLVLA